MLTLVNLKTIDRARASCPEFRSSESPKPASPAVEACCGAVPESLFSELPEVAPWVRSRIFEDAIVEWLLLSNNCTGKNFLTGILITAYAARLIQIGFRCGFGVTSVIYRLENKNGVDQKGPHLYLSVILA